MQQNSINEIGSEFHYVNIKMNVQNNLFSFRKKDEVFTFSGRTAIETILKNVRFVKKALLPSYCCQAMIEPFKKAQIQLDFYDVYYDDDLIIKMKTFEGVDLILWCNYFGFTNNIPDFHGFVSRGGILVEDITHSLLSKKQYHNDSCYVIASLRKWFPLISGGYCSSMYNDFKEKPSYEVPDFFIESKKEAMIEKSKYLENGSKIIKESYLKKFSDLNSWLANNYSNMKIDYISEKIINNIDINYIFNKRRTNAKLIYKYLNSIENIKPLFDEYHMDCPLFVPIIFEDKKKRDLVRNELIKEKIYCPIHWPKPHDQCQSNLYDLELSLVCDQRYDKNDIERMMKILENICLERKIL